MWKVKQTNVVRIRGLMTRMVTVQVDIESQKDKFDSGGIDKAFEETMYRIKGGKRENEGRTKTKCNTSKTTGWVSRGNEGTAERLKEETK